MSTTEHTEAQRRIAFKIAAKSAALLSQREAAIAQIFERQQLTEIDKWITSQTEPSLDRFEAIRRLVAVALGTLK